MSALQALRDSAWRLLSTNNFGRTAIFTSLYAAVCYLIYRRMVRDLFGVGTAKRAVLGRSLELTKAEETLAAYVVNPDKLSVTFNDVGGHQSIKKALEEAVIWPLRFGESHGLSPPTGVLLHGPPGTGKTLIAKALAKEINGYFLDVRVEQLFAKYVGDSEKLCAAVFSLAEKLGKCVIFVDEMDALLGARRDTDSSVYRHAKTIFLSQWDGLSSTNSLAGSSAATAALPKRFIIVVGATNRPKDLDEAVLRRLPVRINVPYPTAEGRHEILNILLREEMHFKRLTEAQREVLLMKVTSMTPGYSGSDLRELCKAALVLPLRNAVDLARQSPQSSGDTAAAALADINQLAPLTAEMFSQAQQRVTSTQSFSSSGSNDASRHCFYLF